MQAKSYFDTVVSPVNEALCSADTVRQAAGARKLTSVRGQYFCERMLQEYETLRFKPSFQATTAVYLALSNDLDRVRTFTTMCRESQSQYPCGSITIVRQPERLVKFTGYTKADLQSCAMHMCRYVSETVTTLSGRPLDPCKRKYCADRFFAFAKVSENCMHILLNKRFDLLVIH